MKKLIASILCACTISSLLVGCGSTSDQADQAGDTTAETQTDAESEESTESTVEDATLPAGQKVVQSYGHTGYSARLWKIVKVNGKQVSKKVFNTSTYMSTPTVYRVGTKKAEKIEEKNDKKDKKNDSKSKTTTAAKSTTAQKTTTKKSSTAKSGESTGN